MASSTTFVRYLGFLRKLCKETDLLLDCWISWLKFLSGETRGSISEPSSLDLEIAFGDSLSRRSPAA